MQRALFAIALTLAVAFGQNCSVLNVQVTSTYSPANSNGISSADLFNRLNSSTPTFVNASQQYFSGLRDPQSTGVLTTIGGDTGEFVLALATYAANGGDLTKTNTIFNSFLSYLNQTNPTRKFYMHIDSTQVAKLVTVANVSSLYATNLASVTSADQPKLLAAMNDTSTIPCDFLADVLAQSDNLGIPTTVPVAFVQAFFTWLWNNTSSNRLVLSYTSSIKSTNVSALVAFGTTDSYQDSCALLAPLIPSVFNSTYIIPDHTNFVGTALRDPLSSFIFPYLNGSTSSSVASVAQFRSQYELLATQAYLASKNLHISVRTPGYNATYNVVASSTNTTQGNTTSTTGMIGTTGIFTNTTTNSTTTTTVSRSKGAAGILIVFLLLFIFLGGTFLAWRYYSKYFGDHRIGRPVSGRKAAASPKSRDNDVVPLEDIGSGYGYSGGYGSHEREEQL